MSTLTARLKLLKPASTDAVDVVTQLSNNFDIIDADLPNAICTSATRPAAPFQGQMIYETDTGFTLFYNGTAWKRIVQLDTTDTLQNKTFDSTNTFNGTVNPTSSTSFKNRFINGSFDIWQRGASIVLTAATGYTADRWVCVSGTGATNTITRTTLGAAATVDVARYAASWARSVAGTVDSTLSQRIENVNQFSGQSVTISGYFTGSGSIDFQLRVLQNFGSVGGSAVVGPTSVGSFTATGTRTRFSVTATIPSILTKTIGTSGDDFLEIQIFRAFNATNGATGTLTIEDMQIEAGPVATAVERVPVNETLARCQRYYRRWSCATAGNGGLPASCLATTTTVVIAEIPLNVPMRATPASGGVSAVGDLSVLGASGTRIACTVFTYASSGSTLDVVRFDITVASGLVAGNSTIISFTSAATTSSYIDVTAEL